MSENMFSSVDALLVPVVPSTLSLRTLEQLETFLDDQNLLCPLWPFITLADRRRTMHREVMESFGQRWPLRLSSVIPAASAVERMGLERAPLRHFAPYTPACRAYASLWTEIQQRLA